MTIAEYEAELANVDHWRLHDALYDYCFDPKHEDDFFNIGVFESYVSLPRDIQLKVLKEATQ